MVCSLVDTWNGLHDRIVKCNEAASVSYDTHGCFFLILDCLHGIGMVCAHLRHPKQYWRTVSANSVNSAKTRPFRLLPHAVDKCAAALTDGIAQCCWRGGLAGD